MKFMNCLHDFQETRRVHDIPSDRWKYWDGEEEDWLDIQSGDIILNCFTSKFMS